MSCLAVKKENQIILSGKQLGQLKKKNQVILSGKLLGKIKKRGRGF